MSGLLRIKNISKNFLVGDKNLSVLEEVSLDIEQGDMISIQGKSGVGKTTLLNILGLLDESYSGSLLYDGVLVNKMNGFQKARWRNQNIGFVFQFFYLLHGLTVLENVMLPRMIGRKSSSQAYKDSLQLLEQLGLSERASHFPFQISGGEQQRVCLARAMINKPSLLLLDEPTGNLDEKNSDEIESLIRELHNEFKMSIVTVTHNESFAQFHKKCFYLSQMKLILL